MQKLLVVSRLLLPSPNNLILQASADLQMPQNYSEQPVSKTIQITGTAENCSMWQTDQLAVCGTDFGV
jgi:hypothetical protein